jgi:hypothetical protein
VKRLPLILAGVIVVAAVIWLYIYAPCGVFYWNNAKDTPERCRAALGRG